MAGQSICDIMNCIIGLFFIDRDIEVKHRVFKLAIKLLNSSQLLNRPFHIRGILVMPRIGRVPPHLIEGVLPVMDIAFPDKPGPADNSLPRGVPALIIGIK